MSQAEWDRFHDKGIRVAQRMAALEDTTVHTEHAAIDMRITDYAAEHSVTYSEAFDRIVDTVDDPGAAIEVDVDRQAVDQEVKAFMADNDGVTYSQALDAILEA